MDRGKTQNKLEATKISKEADLHEYAEGIIDTVREPLIILDQDLRVISANRSFYSFFKVTPKETAGQFIYDLGNKQWDIPKLRELLENIIPQKETFDDYDVEHDFATIGRRIMLLNARQIKRAAGKESIILLAIEDITERKRLENTLTESEERYRRLFETASDGIVLLEKREGKIASANPAIEKMLGYTKEETVGNKLQDMGVLLDMGDFQTTMQTLSKSGVIYYKDVPVETKSEQHIDTDIYLVDKATLVQCNIRDITERKQTDENLKKKEKILQGFFDAVHETMVLIDAKGTVLLSNVLGAQRLGKTVQEFVGTCLYDSFPPDVARHRKEHYEKVINTGKPVYFEDTRSGMFFEHYCYPFFDKERNISGVTIFAHEITERKRSEEALRQSEEKFKYLFEYSIVGKSITLPSGEIYVNVAFCEMLGYTNDELSGLKWPDITHPDDIELTQRSVDALFSGEKDSIRLVKRYVHKNGSVVWGDMRTSLRRDKDGKPLYLITSVSDITSRKQAEDRQQLVNNILEALNSPNDVSNLAYSILLFLKDYTGIDAVGIRLREGEDYPYVETNGFPGSFIETERYLCSRDEHNEIVRDVQGNPYLECMCGNIICGRTDPSLPFFTEGGSFWTNSTSKLLASTSEENRQARTRNRCNDEGYESVALIPLRSGEDTVGLLQLNDKRPDRFTLDMIEFLEETAASIGIAVSRRQAQETLKISEAKYRRIVETAKEGITTLDENFKFTNVNAQFAKMMGYSPEELIGTGPIDLAFEEDIPELLEAYNKRRWGISEPFEHRFRRKDGSIIWLYVSAIPVFDEAGRVKGSFSMQTDITQRKQAERALQQSEAKYRSIFDNAAEGIYQSRPDGGFITVNPALARIYGYESPGEMMASITDIGKELYIDPEERTKYKNILEEYGMVNNFEAQSPKKDGSIIWVSLSARAIKDAKRKTLYIDGIVEDITSRKMAEDKLTQTMVKLRRSLVGTIRVMSVATEIRDPYTAGHQKKVSNLARLIAQEMGLPGDTVENIRMAGIIHDIGKISVPAEILSKPVKLTDIEFELIKAHPRVGYDILKEAELPCIIAEMILQHHERLDGSGYPQGLKSDQIRLESQIIAVADVVEAIASHRPYRPALGIEVALEEIEKNEGVLYDEKVVDTCLKLFREKGFRFESNES